MQVQGLGKAIQPLLGDEHAAVNKISWPTSVVATENFSRYADGDIETSSHGRLRHANHLAISSDGSIVALSNREAEYLLRADRSLRQSGKQQSMQVAITHLAFIRWLHPAAASTDPQAPSSVLLPWHAFWWKLGS
jgi:hypothetical protein